MHLPPPWLGWAAATAVALVLVLWRRTRLRRAFERLLEVSCARVGGDVLAHRFDLVGGLEAVSEATAEEVRALRQRLATLQAEEDAVRGVLARLQPSSFEYALGGLDIAGVGAARGRCGGDWTMVRRLDQTHVLVALGDVAGHDAASAYLAAAIAGALRVMSSQLLRERPERALTRLAQVVDELSHQRLTSTCVLVVLDLDTRRMRVINAGHPAPWLLRDGAVAQSLASSGGPLGLPRAGGHAVVDVQLQPLDRLVFFTDGLLEQPDTSGRLFGQRRLLEMIRRHLTHTPRAGSQQLLTDVLRGFREFARGSPRGDDVSVVICSVAAEDATLAPLSPISDEEMPTQVNLVPHPSVPVPHRRRLPTS
jgi:serine phosphatase RsbU (regulator of sigma subunit)